MTNLWVDGIGFDDNASTRAVALQLAPGGGDTAAGNVIRRCAFYNVTTTSAATNESGLFFFGGAGAYNVVQDCDFYNITTGMALLGYDSPKTIIEGNSFDGCYQNISPKDSNVKWTLRGNTVINGNESGILTQCYSSPFLPRDIEICFNYVQSTSNACRINQEYNRDTGAHWIYRNTFVGRCSVTNVYNDETSGPFIWQNNIILSSEGQIVKNVNPPEAPEKLIISDNVFEPLGSAIIDGAGMLQGAARDTYLGINGWET
jgi:hypothetical protein